MDVEKKTKALQQVDKFIDQYEKSLIKGDKLEIHINKERQVKIQLVGRKNLN